MSNHLSSQTVACLIKRISACGRAVLYADLLATDRVYLQTMSPWLAVGSYPTRFIFSLMGSLVSVALSLGSPPVAVSDCHALCCPDFPLRTLYGSTGRLLNELPDYKYIKKYDIELIFTKNAPVLAVDARYSPP